MSQLAKQNTATSLQTPDNIADIIFHTYVTQGLGREYC